MAIKLEADVVLLMELVDSTPINNRISQATAEFLVADELLQHLYKSQVGERLHKFLAESSNLKTGIQYNHNNHPPMECKFSERIRPISIKEPAD